MIISLRLITILFYFLPFTFFLATCHGLEVDMAYNQKEADKNILLAKQLTKEVATDEEDSTLLQKGTAILDTSENASLSDESLERASFILPRSSKDFWSNLLQSAAFPVDKSASAFGSIFWYKNYLGQIIIGLSFFLSIILLITSKILKLKKIQKYLLLLNLLCVLVFIIDSLLSGVILLYGAWALLTILILQVAIEYKLNKNLGFDVFEIQN